MLREVEEPASLSVDVHNYEICTILSRILGSWIRASSMDCLHLFVGLRYGYEVITSS